MTTLKGREKRRATKSRRREELSRLRARVDFLEKAETTQREERAFLTHAADVLYSSPDHAATLGNLGRLLVPRIADWGAVYLAEGPSVRRVGVVHFQPEKEHLMEALRARQPPDVYTAHPVLEVLRTGQPILAPYVNHEQIARNTRDAEELEMVERVGVCSAMVVPLLCHGAALGAVSLITCESGRRFGLADLALAQEVARLAGAALDRARHKREAQEAVQARDEFLHITSHELRGPLNALLLHLQLLLRSRGEAGFDVRRVESEVGVCLRQVRHIDRLIELMLDVSRISAGQLDLRREPCDLADVAREVVAQLSDEMAQAGSAVSVRADQPAHGMWDRARLEQVATNLLSNAIKYGAGKPIEIAITATQESAVLSVRDHGIGICAEDQLRIFERFARATPVQRQRSLGLGLYIVRKCVDAMGGTVRVSSEPGVGSTFTVELPRNRPAAVLRNSESGGPAPIRPA